MKNLFITLLLGCLSYCGSAQNTSVTFGRYGNCNSGRGICGIQTNTRSQTQNNADFIWLSKQLILRIYTHDFTVNDRLKFLEDKPNGTQALFTPQVAFNLDPNTIAFIRQLSGLTILTLEARPYHVVYGNHYIDLYFNSPNPWKQKS